MNNGFDRLRGAAVAGVMGLGSLMAGSGRAATTGAGFRLTYNSSIAWGGYVNGTSGILPFQTGTAVNGTGYFAPGLGDVCTFFPSVTTGGFSLQNNSAAATNFCLREAGLFDVFALTAATSLANTTGSAFLIDAFDGVMAWAIDGWVYANPVTSMDLDNAVVGGTMTNIVPGINAQASFWFSPDYAVVRSVMTLTNTTGTPIAITATVRGNLGSDGSTRVQATSDGDTFNEDTDLWVATSDTPAGIDAVDGFDPVILTTRFGAGGLAPRVEQFRLGAGVDNYMYHYDFTVPANSSASVMVFHVLTRTILTADLFGNDFESLTFLDVYDLLDGLSNADLLKIVNYGDAAALVATRDDHGDSIGTATAVALRSSVVGEIGVAGDVDVFQIDMPSSGVLVVNTTGTTDTVGYLLNSTGTQLATDDDGGSDVNFRISQSVTAGTYYVMVEHFSGTGTGAYTLVTGTGAVSSTSSSGGLGPLSLATLAGLLSLFRTNRRKCR